MTSPQPDLFDQPRHEAVDDVLWLEKVLHDNNGWMTSTEILQLIGRPATDAGQRWLRRLASLSKWILSGPGSPGYRHIACSTPDEIRHYYNSNISQRKEMIARGIRIKRAAHEVFG